MIKNKRFNNHPILRRRKLRLREFISLVYFAQLAVIEPGSQPGLLIWGSTPTCGFVRALWLFFFFVLPWLIKLSTWPRFPCEDSRGWLAASPQGVWAFREKVQDDNMEKWCLFSLWVSSCWAILLLSHPPWGSHSLKGVGPQTTRSVGQTQCSSFFEGSRHSLLPRFWKWQSLCGISVGMLFNDCKFLPFQCPGP